MPMGREKSRWRASLSGMLEGKQSRKGKKDKERVWSSTTISAPVPIGECWRTVDETLERIDDEQERAAVAGEGERDEVAETSERQRKESARRGQREESAQQGELVAATVYEQPTQTPTLAPSPVAVFQAHFFNLPLEIRSQVYDYVLELGTTLDFAAQESLKYQVSPALGYPRRENYSSISVTMSRSWCALHPEHWASCCAVGSDADRLYFELKRHFAAHTTFVISTSVFYPAAFPPADGQGRFGFLDAPDEMQLLRLLDDDSLAPWLHLVQNAKLIFTLSSATGGDCDARCKDVNGELELRSSTRYAVVAKMAWIMQHMSSMRRLDVCVTHCQDAPTTAEWVWSLLEPLKLVSGIRSIVVSGLEIRDEVTSSINRDGKESASRCYSAVSQRKRWATKLKWQNALVELETDANKSPSIRIPFFQG